MTNNWTDIGNASCVFVMGANPSENHPACMAHINAARAKGAKLIVVDPRKTRTATQADKYIRIRPGTDIAFLNGVLKIIIANMEARSVGDSVRDKFYEFLNWTGNGSFFADGSASLASTLKTAVPRNSKYTDARFVVNGTGTDYVREQVVATTGLPTVGGETADTVISNFPKKADNVFGYTDNGTPTGTLVTAEPNTVYNKLKAHVAPYTAAVVANICGCTTAELDYVAQAFIAHSRCSSPGAVSGAGAQNPTQAGYKALTMLYAMGITQHTYGGQNVKEFAVIQTLMGNMGRAGGGINALRGIHNVQGSTDMGLLYGNIPFYSGNPTVKLSADANAFGKYMDGLWGLPLWGSGGRTAMDSSYNDAYNLASGIMGLQQRGFFNMTYNFFGDPAWITTPTADRAVTDGLYDLWPKGNGYDHISMFRAMTGATPETKALVVWGQNPAVTEPNQSWIRDAIFNLETLVCVDLFENETAAAKRNDTGVTYLIPTCSHAEEAGSVTNSGRVLQWRERATLPKGNSKADLELLFRFAYALDGASAFTHLTDKWTALGKSYTSAYATLYGSRYGWTPGDATAFEDVASPATVEIWRGADTTPTTGVVYGSEWFAEQIYQEMCKPTVGTSWLYTGAYNSSSAAISGTDLREQRYYANTHAGQPAWETFNRAKSRNTSDPNSTLAFPGWGYSWLVNRRVFYNNSDIPGDVADFYMGPDSCSRLFVCTNTGAGVVPGASGTPLNYSRWYRFYHRLADKPDTCLVSNTYPHVLPGRFPGHTEPYETPRADLATTWGRNTKGGAQWDLVKADTKVAAPGRSHSAASFPFVLTTIRCVEHFQGGPITRNNAWNVEAEPEPWIELNSLDASAKGIVDGDWVNVITARSNSTTDQQGRTYAAPGFAKGFRARVGVGLQSNQRVGKGVVAIPWHWGDRGLSTGSRANDLCIDAGDANTMIPEYKACLCNIEKA